MQRTSLGVTSENSFALWPPTDHNTVKGHCDVEIKPINVCIAAPDVPSPECVQRPRSSCDREPRRQHCSETVKQGQVEIGNASGLSPLFCSHLEDSAQTVKIACDSAGCPVHINVRE